MSKLVWDETGEHFYETGVQKGVLYPKATDGSYPAGYAWNGLTGVTESPSGAEATDLYANDTKYLSLRSVEEFGGTIEAYTYPDEFAECDGSVEVVPGIHIHQQTRKSFGLSYRTTLGNDTDREDYGYKLHLVYGATASPSEKEYATINDSPEAITMSWEFDTIPVAVTGHKSTSCLTIDSTKVDDGVMATIEDILYGTNTTEARLPLPDEIIALLSGTTTEDETETEENGTEDSGNTENEDATGSDDNTNDNTTENEDNTNSEEGTGNTENEDNTNSEEGTGEDENGTDDGDDTDNN